MNMKFVVTLAALVLTSAASAAEPLGYPGQTWGVLTFPAGVIDGSPEHDNWLYQGRVVQGVDWFKFGEDQNWVFDTYGAFGFSVDSKNLDYNNKIVPAAGMKLSRFSDHGVIEAGVEAVYERHFGDDAGGGYDRSGYGVQGYISYWFGWDAKK